MALKNKDVIRGIKIRLSEFLKDLDLVVLGLAQQAADAAGIPVAVHVSGGMRSSLSDVVARLKPGDMVTHFMHGGEKTMLDDRGKILPAVREARQRGVYFDVGHGRSSFSFAVAEKALHDGFIPDSLSSDLHVYNVKGPVFDQITTLSKFLYLGLTLEQVIERATTRPAKIIRRPDLGTLKIDSEADVAILELREGEFELVDSLRQKRVARRRLLPVATVRAGKLIKPAEG
jgi:dihydroorotase